LGFGETLPTLRRKRPAYFGMLPRASELMDFCEDGNEPSGSIRGREFLEYLSDINCLGRALLCWVSETGILYNDLF